MRSGAPCLGLAFGSDPHPSSVAGLGPNGQGPPVPRPHHTHFRENTRPLLAFVFVLMDAGRKFFIPQQKQQTCSCCT